MVGSPIQRNSMYAPVLDPSGPRATDSHPSKVAFYWHLLAYWCKGRGITRQSDAGWDCRPPLRRSLGVGGVKATPELCGILGKADKVRPRTVQLGTHMGKCGRDENRSDEVGYLKAMPSTGLTSGSEM